MKKFFVIICSLLIAGSVFAKGTLNKTIISYQPGFVVGTLMDKTDDYNEIGAAKQPFGIHIGLAFDDFFY